jgi:hypothetical protein
MVQAENVDEKRAARAPFSKPALGEARPAQGSWTVPDTTLAALKELGSVFVPASGRDDAVFAEELGGGLGEVCALEGWSSSMHELYWVHFSAGFLDSRRRRFFCTKLKFRDLSAAFWEMGVDEEGLTVVMENSKDWPGSGLPLSILNLESATVQRGIEGMDALFGSMLLNKTPPSPWYLEELFHTRTLAFHIPIATLSTSRPGSPFHN